TEQCNIYAYFRISTSTNIIVIGSRKTDTTYLLTRRYNVRSGTKQTKCKHCPILMSLIGNVGRRFRNDQPMQN
ncbi:MAG: hypothetical protein ACKPKO_48770, partial [Candidatus Fonsibacter sp.]